MASSTTIVNPTTIFREYIGSKPYPDTLHDFPDIINPKIKEFHFIIAFASEKYDDISGKGTGEFHKNWIVPPIDGQMIQNLKKKYQHESVNVKVVISIGGRGTKYAFNPDNKDKWAENAENSLVKIINDLNDEAGNFVIDGIDINYDIISDGYVFDRCIGSLIDRLKNVRHLVSVVSIAPSRSVQPYYRVLYQHNENDIDWVNYQFYTHTINSAGEFEELYRTLAEVYGHKLLAGFSTDQADDGNLPLGVFYKACEDLIRSGELPGIFIWNANDSQVEQIAQELLTQN